jgi:integrase
MVGSASGKQVDAEATLGGRPVALRFADDARGREYNPGARARPPRLVRESSHTPVFEEAEIVAFLDSISLESLKDIRDKAIFSVLFYSWCRVSALINLTVTDYYERGRRTYQSSDHQNL